MSFCNKFLFSNWILELAGSMGERYRDDREGGLLELFSILGDFGCFQYSHFIEHLLRNIFLQSLSSGD